MTYDLENIRTRDDGIRRIVDRVRGHHCLKDPDVEIPALVDAVERAIRRRQEYPVPETDVLPPRVLEIGTYRGATAAALYLAFQHVAIEVTTIDLPEPERSTYNPQGRELTGIAIHDLGLAGRVREIRMDSADLGSLQIHPDRYDLVFVDGDHTEEIVYRDLVLSADLLQPWGSQVVHDYLPVSTQHRPDWTIQVQRAVDAYAAGRGLRARLLGGWLIEVVRPEHA